MKLTMLRFVATPLMIAAGALTVREVMRESPAEPTPGHATPLVPEALIAWLAQRLPRDAEFVVDSARSSVRISSDVDDAWADTYVVAGHCAFDGDGELGGLTLELTPRASASVGDSAPPMRAPGKLTARSSRRRTTPVPALRAAVVDARFTLAADACDVELDVRWTVLPDGAVVVQGEAHLPSTGFGLPPGAWPRILRAPPLGMLAFDLVLTRRE